MILSLQFYQKAYLDNEVNFQDTTRDQITDAARGLDSCRNPKSERAQWKTPTGPDRFASQENNQGAETERAHQNACPNNKELEYRDAIRKQTNLNCLTNSQRPMSRGSCRGEMLNNEYHRDSLTYLTLHLDLYQKAYLDHDVNSQDTTQPQTAVEAQRRERCWDPPPERSQ